ncbi:MAG: putative membrane protein, partial [Litorivivens sp.]
MLSTKIIIQFFTVFLCVSLWTKLSAQTNDSTETST